MTDEELAEEYYYKTYPVTLNIGEEERKKEVTDIFLAGLKAGRPKWHELLKDPKDLPENYMGASRLVVNQEGMPCYYNYMKNRWECWGLNEMESPLYWSELPQFKE